MGGAFSVNNTYLNWVLENTATTWWHDSACPAELELGLERGAIGATTNPFLSAIALRTERALWASDIDAVLARNLPAEQKAEALMQIPVMRTAARFLPEYERSGKTSGFVCAQVNPVRAGDRDCMMAMAKRFHAWAPNIAVKLPATAAGVAVLEDCIAEGITCTATVSFTVPQLLAVGARHQAGKARAKAAGIEPGRCFSTLMIGRLDDYLREVAHDNQAAVTEEDIRQSGLAVAKRAWAIYQERGYDATLLIAALRGPYHLTELAGAPMIFSIHPTPQAFFCGDQDHPREQRIDVPIAKDVIDRLSTMPEFVRAYEPDGMTENDFIGLGVTQRTLCQFSEVGWKLMESYK
jgi:transaldolase